MAGSMGFAVNNSRAVLEGLFKRKSEFVRTPEVSHSIEERFLDRQELCPAEDQLDGDRGDCSGRLLFVRGCIFDLFSGDCGRAVPAPVLPRVYVCFRDVAEACIGCAAFSIWQRVIWRNSILPNPEFARRAAELLAQGQLDEAMEICRDRDNACFPGMRRDSCCSGHATNRWGNLRRRCAEYRKALQIHPDNYSCTGWWRHEAFSGALAASSPLKRLPQTQNPASEGRKRKRYRSRAMNRRARSSDENGLSF